MAGGFIDTSGTVGKQYEGKLTFYVEFAIFIAAMGGLMFGYDIGISGGVTEMDDFLQEFVPHVYNAKRHTMNNYCQYNNQGLQAFTSSLFLAGMMASLLAAFTTRRWGRVRSIRVGGFTFLIGAILTGAAQNLAMLILGRFLLGTGIGLCHSIFLRSPVHWRGSLNILFQLIVTMSIFGANLVNYGMGKVTPWGWRVSLGLAGIPGAIVFLGSLFLPETPYSLLEWGRTDEARKVLEKIRGTSFVDEEINDMGKATAAANEIKNPSKNIFQRKYIPQIVVGWMIPFFTQMTGINVATYAHRMAHAMQLQQVTPK